MEAGKNIPISPDCNSLSVITYVNIWPLWHSLYGERPSPSALLNQLWDKKDTQDTKDFTNRHWDKVQLKSNPMSFKQEEQWRGSSRQEQTKINKKNLIQTRTHSHKLNNYTVWGLFLTVFCFKLQHKASW